jgi:hypothetical protein
VADFIVSFYCVGLITTLLVITPAVFDNGNVARQVMITEHILNPPYLVHHQTLFPHHRVAIELYLAPFELLLRSGDSEQAEQSERSKPYVSAEA